MSVARGCHDDRDRPASGDDHRGTPSAVHKDKLRLGKTPLHLHTQDLCMNSP